jgi:hypothetical protein
LGAVAVANQSPHILDEISEGESPMAEHAMPRDHQGDYGIDGSFKVISARGQAIGIGVWSAALAAWSAISAARGKRLTAALTGASSLGIAASTALYIYVTKAGKFRVWQRILDELVLHGD